jgi:hypothetical protein
LGKLKEYPTLRLHEERYLWIQKMGNAVVDISDLSSKSSVKGPLITRVSGRWRAMSLSGSFSFHHPFPPFHSIINCQSITLTHLDGFVDRIKNLDDKLGIVPEALILRQQPDFG